MLIWYPWQVAYRISNLIHGFFFFFTRFVKIFFYFAGAINTKSKVNVTTHRGISNCVILLLSLPSPITYAFSSPPIFFFFCWRRPLHSTHTQFLRFFSFGRLLWTTRTRKSLVTRFPLNWLVRSRRGRHKLLSQTCVVILKWKCISFSSVGGGDTMPSTRVLCLWWWHWQLWI